MVNIDRNFGGRIFLIMVVCMCFPAVVTAAIHVELEVSGGTSLVATANDSQCTDGPIDCIDVVKGSSPNLYFDLDNACKPDGPDYQLVQIRIAMSEKDWPTTSNPLPDDVAEDFYADRDTGIVDLAGGNHGWNDLSKSRIKLKDKNSGAYTVFYEITARQCTGDGTIMLDPMVRNGGK